MERKAKILDRHLRHWRERGLVSVELESRLRDASAELDQQTTGTVLRGALALLGGGLLLAGGILIVAENWEALHRGVKLAGWALLQILFLAGAYGFGRRWPDRPYLVEAFALVAGGWVLAGIALVSQIYQLDARPPNGLWLWVALMLPAAWALPRRAVGATIFVALASALALEVGQKDSWIHAEHVDGPWLWLGLPLLVGAVVSLLPRPPAALRGWLGAWVLGASQVFLLVLGTVQELDRSDLGRAWIVAAAGVVAALAFPARVLPRSWDSLTGRLLLLGSLAPWVLLGARFDRGGWLDQLGIGLAWIVQLAACVLVIRAGARAASVSWVNLGYLGLLAGILTRYVDFFGDFLEGGAALVLTGLLLLFVLYALEKARRRTLSGGPPLGAAPMKEMGS